MKSLLKFFVLAVSVSLFHLSAFAQEKKDYNAILQMPVTGGYTYMEKMIECPDGVKLLTRFYIPDGEGPHPFVVTRNPYVPQGSGDYIELGREYAKRGLGYIQQDCRGKGGSEGFFYANIYEREDGLALYKWLDKQAWVGDLGIFGISYTALTGWIVADAVPEKVKAMYYGHYGADNFISSYRGGLFREDLMTGWAVGVAEQKNLKRPVLKEGQKQGEQNYEFYRYNPQINADVAIMGDTIPFYREWISHPDHSDPYWNSGPWYYLKHAIPKINVPITIVAGQFDIHEDGTLLAWNLLPEETKAKSRLVLGAWEHNFIPNPQHVATDRTSEFNTQTEEFKWFYNILVKKEQPKKQIDVFAIESNKWISLDSWPIKQEKDVKFYFSNEKVGSKDNVLKLTEYKSKKQTLKYDYDPENPILVNGGETMFTTWSKRGSHQMDEPGTRDDIISFISEPLKEDMTISGEVKAMLNVSTDVDDTEFSFVLSEVMPDGKAYNMRTAVNTLAYNNDPLGDRKTYKPNTKVKMGLVSFPIIWTVKAGNRLRIDIQSSNFPEYNVHTNYAGNWTEQTKTRVAHQKLYIGDEKSYVTFPVVDINHLNTK